jgi:transposase
MDNLLMSTRERRKLTEFSLVKQGRSTVAEAARRLDISERQARRDWKRYRELGDAGLIHGLKGRSSNFGKDDLRRLVIEVYRQKYLSFNAAHAAEMLERKEKLVVPRQTLWRWLKAEGLVDKPRRVRAHRSRRERRTCVGEMIQMDGSTHPWFGPDHPYCVLFVMVDDASSAVFCRFYELEATLSAFDLFGRYVKRHGLPSSLYVDYDSIYVVNNDKAHERARQAGRKPPLTQFGRAMDELDVRIICAGSPQAKGRVERMNRTLQDRLLKELSIELEGQGVHELKQANDFLEKQFLPRFNQRFTKVPASGVNVHRCMPRGRWGNLQLSDILCHKESRVVGQDWCVQFHGLILQIARRHESLKLAKKSIEVWQHADGQLQLRHRGQRLTFTEITQKPAKQPVERPQTFNPPWRPPLDHPWRRGLPCRYLPSLPLLDFTPSGGDTSTETLTHDTSTETTQSPMICVELTLAK